MKNPEISNEHQISVREQFVYPFYIKNKQQNIDSTYYRFKRSFSNIAIRNLTFKNLFFPFLMKNKKLKYSKTLKRKITNKIYKVYIRFQKLEPQS